MKKIFWASIFLFVFILTLSAKQISQLQSLDVVIELFSSNKNLRSDNYFQLVHTAYDNSSDLRSEQTALYYVYNASDQGFVIVSADDCVYPVIAYSFEGKYDPENCAPGFLRWMENTESGISGAIRTGKEPDERTIKAWEAFLSGDSDALRSSQSVSSLTQSQWGQASPYYDKCPTHNGKNTVTGCVATAMAQIMYYYKYPSRGIGRSTAYSTSTSNIRVSSVNYAGTEYQWDAMTTTYNVRSSTEAKEAVATLMFHCGVSVQMDYGTDASGAYTWDAGSALRNTFGYDLSVGYKFKDYYSYSEWKNILFKELSEGRPVLYGGQSPKEGHAFVCDGYDSYGMFYFNWGWDGANNNGYYNIENFEYKDGNELIIGIQPNIEAAPSFELVVGPNTDLYPNGDIECLPTEILQEETFTARSALWNIGYGTFTGSLGFVILDSNNNIIEVVGLYNQEIELGEYYGLTQKVMINCKVSSSVPDGTYRLKAAVKPNDGEWQTINAENGYVGEIALKVGNTNAISDIGKDREIQIYVENKNLILETPYNETVFIYNSLGIKLQQVNKNIGQETISIPNSIGNEIIILKGSSGWTKKVLITN